MALTNVINMNDNDYISIENGIELPNYLVVNVVDDIIYITDKYRRVGFINLRTRLVSNNIICPPAYDYIDHFKDGVALFKLNNKWGLIDDNGNVLAKPQYSKIYEFKNGIARVDIFHEEIKKGLSDCYWTYSYINLNGELLYPDIRSEKYMPEYIFNNHDILLINFNSDDYNYYLLNKDGIKKIYKQVAVIDENNWILYGDDKCYIQNRHTLEKKEIDAPYTYINNFKNGVGVTELNRKLGLINRFGRVLSEPIYDKIFDFCDGVAPVCLNDKWGIINITGKEVLKPTYDSISKFHNGIAIFKQNSRYGIINTNGEILCEAVYILIRSFVDGYAVAVNDSGNNCLINEEGKVINNYYAVVDYLCKKKYEDYKDYMFTNLVDNRGEDKANDYTFMQFRNSKYVIKYYNAKSHGLINQEGKCIYTTQRPIEWMDYLVHGKLIVIKNRVKGTTKIIDWTGKEITPDLVGNQNLRIVNDNYIIINNILIDIHEIERKYRLDIECNNHTIERYFNNAEEREKIINYFKTMRHGFLLRFKSYLDSICKDNEIDDKTKLLQCASEKNFESAKKRNYRKVKKIR